MNADWETDPVGATWASCLQASIAAPSVHNSQPWRFRLGLHHVDVFVDKSRQLATVDPMGREAMISVGAAVLNLRVAILAAGRIPLTQLLPNPDEADLAARITVGARHQPDATVRALASAIGKRRTNRRPFRDIDIRDDVIDQLTTAARAEAAALTVADQIGREAIFDMVRSAHDAQTRDPRYIAELDNRTHPDVDRRQAPFEAAPTVVTLSTDGDTSLQWLRVGQAMERVLLTATVRGVANTPMTAPTELHERRGLLNESGDRRIAQVIVRLGYGDPCAPTPRRPLADVLETARPTAASPVNRPGA